MPGRTQRSEASLGPAAGAKVHVRWGLDLLPGRLVERYDSSSGGRVVVRLDAEGPGSSEPQTVTVPASDVYPSEDVAEIDPPGTWVQNSKYEREVIQALSRVLRRIKRLDAAKLEHMPDARYDYVANTNLGRFVVEVKYSHRGEFTEKRAYDAARLMEKMPAALKVLVSNARFTDGSKRHLAPSHVTPITWRSPKDDHLMEMAISAALEEASDSEDADTKPPRGRSVPSRLPSARPPGGASARSVKR